MNREGSPVEPLTRRISEIVRVGGMAGVPRPSMMGAGASECKAPPGPLPLAGRGPERPSRRLRLPLASGDPTPTSPREPPPMTGRIAAATIAVLLARTAAAQPPGINQDEAKVPPYT